MAQEYEQLRCEQMAKIDTAERAAWVGWRRSLRVAEKKYAKVTKVGDDARQESGKTEQPQAGDPRFLQVVLACVEARLRLLGAGPGDEGPAGPPELVVRVLGPGLSMRELHGGTVVDAGQVVFEGGGAAGGLAGPPPLPG
jgi:hypothetical protein